MYLAGVSVRRVEDITEALWGTRVSPSTVSDLNKIYGTIEAWRSRPIEGEHPYVYLDGIVLKRSWAGEVRNVSLLVAIGVNSEGYREVLGICEEAKGDKAGWGAFLKHLKERGLKRVRLRPAIPHLPPASRHAHQFFDTTSFITSISRSRSTTSFFGRAFSPSSCRRRRTSLP